jgi:hypothetical protein
LEGELQKRLLWDAHSLTRLAGVDQVKLIVRGVSKSLIFAPPQSRLVYHVSNFVSVIGDVSRSDN